MFEEIYLGCKIIDIEECPVNDWNDLSSHQKQNLNLIASEGIYNYDLDEEVTQYPIDLPLPFKKNQEDIFHITFYQDKVLLINDEGYNYPKYTGVLINSPFKKEIDGAK